MITHICHVDCRLTVELDPSGEPRLIHMMYASLPTSAAGRYQWEQNQRILRQGRGARKAWQTTGQGETRTCREWNLRRVQSLEKGGTRLHGLRATYRDLHPDVWKMID